MKECNQCSLCQLSDPTCIMGSGPKEAEIMVINSYATDLDEENEVATIPDQLQSRLEAMGINTEEIYYTNAIKCNAPRGTKYKVGDINKCKKLYLDEEIAQVKPKYVLLLGAQALKATLNESITSVNGVVIEKEGIKYLPSYSPSIIYRDPGKARFVDQAMANFEEMVNGRKKELPELNIHFVTTKRQIEEAVNSLKGKAISYDIETTGLDRFTEVITLFGFGNDKVQYILPLEVKFSPLRGKKIAQAKLIRYLIDQLNQKAKVRVAANGKFDNLFTEFHFGRKCFLDFDLVLASHCLNENTPNGVKENAILECNALNWDVDKSLKTGKVKSRQDYQKYTTYLGYDIYYEYKLYKVFRKRIKKDPSLENLFFHLYMPGIRAYEDIEAHGVYINVKQFKEVRRVLEARLQEIKAKLDSYKEGVNWSSTSQVSKFLYQDLKLPIIETTASGNPSTSEATLLQLKGHHEAVELLLQYRGVKIQISHFVDGWINRMYNGKLYPHYKLHGTVTGRTSCTDPNLQQVPRDPTIRNLVGAPKGWTFVEADFSQAELRIAAILSNDTAMKRIYQTGGDIHSSTYEIITGEKVSDDKYERKEQRKKAKAVNFGFLYGMGAKKFREYARDSYGVSLTDKEAEQYRNKFFATYNNLPKWHNKQRQIVKTVGQVRNPIGRIRRLPDIYSSDKAKKAEAERQSINSPVQGFGSDLTILGMVECLGYAALDNGPEYELDRSRLFSVGTVHDATLYLIRNDYLMEALPKIKYKTENPKVLSEIFKFESPIPIVVDLAIGRSWGAGKELDFDGDWEKDVREYLDGLEK